MIYCVELEEGGVAEVVTIYDRCGKPTDEPEAAAGMVIKLPNGLYADVEIKGESPIHWVH